MPAHRHGPGKRQRAGFPWWLLVVAVAVTAAALYLWNRAPGEVSLPRSGAVPGDVSPQAGNAAGGAGASPAGTPGAGPGPTGQSGAEPEAAGSTGEAAADRTQTDDGRARFPLPEADDASAAASLPAAEASDPPILDALLGLATRETLARFVNLQDFTRRFVITVDHLPRERIPGQWNALRPVPGLPVIGDDDGRMVLRSENFRRYDAFVQFAGGLDPAAVAKIYRHFYPLLQEQYRALGYPQGHLNDRVVAAIDDMLSAPAVAAPIVLVQPRVQYRFEDPSLESLSAGRKIMIRVGPEHAARLQRILRALRRQIAG